MPAPADSHDLQTAAPPHERAKFTWPPSKGDAPPAAPPVEAPQQLKPVSSLARNWWSQIEEAWLGRVSPPFRELADREGWRPDPLSAACPRCAHSVGLFEAVGFEGETFGCPNCRDLRLPWSHAVRLGEHAGILRDAIHDTKFTAFRRTGETLGELLAVQLKPILAQAAFTTREIRLVPVPMSLRRRLSRGIHHTLAISRGMRRVLGVPILNCLSRRHTPSQLEVAPSQRPDNVKRSMRLRKAPSEQVRLLILVDDVMTTGATMREACRAVRADWKRLVPPTKSEAETDVQFPAAVGDLWIATCAVAVGDKGPVR